MNPVFMVLLENREQDGKEEHKMTFDMDSIIWLVIMLVKDPKGVVKAALFKKK